MDFEKIFDEYLEARREELLSGMPLPSAWLWVN